MACSGHDAISGGGTAGSGGIADSGNAAGHGGAAGHGTTASSVGSVGSGGDPCDPPSITPDEVMSAEECVYTGCGGADCPSCYPFTIELSQPVPLSGLSATLTTSEDVFVGCGLTHEEPPAIVCESPNNSTVERLLVASYCGTSFEVDSFHIEVQSNGTPIAAQTYDQLSYSCIDQTSDDWCWQADPVQLEIMP